jgi:hypothetical protein
MMESTIRTERTFGVTAQLRQTQRRNLLNLLNSEIYPDLLDVMEMVCIEKETELINTDPANELAVLANHRMAKAAWQVFTHMQEKIEAETKLFLASVAKPTPVPNLTPEEQMIENILDPTKPLSSEAEDYVGI